MSDLSVGDIVLAPYNSGEYIGEYVEDRGNFALVKVLAVLKHPTQGDLHNPEQVEGVAFFERKALAYTEKMNARKRTLQPYFDEVPTYNESLRKAVDQFKAELSQEDTKFNQASLQKLHDLETYFYKKLITND